MVNYCSECGVKLEPGSRFCPECGTLVEDPDLAAAVPAAEPAPAGMEETDHRKQVVAPAIAWLKQYKWAAYSFLALLLVLGGLYSAGAYFTDGNRIVSRFEQAVKKGDAAALASLLQPGDKALIVNKDTALPLLNYLKKDEFARAFLVEELRDQVARAEKANKADKGKEEFTASEGLGSSIIQVKKSGKTLWLFDHYSLVVTPIYPYVDTTYEGTEISVDGKVIATSDEEHFGEELGPLMPGTHDMTAKYVGKYATLETKETVTFSDARKYYKVDLDLEGSYINLASDERDAAIFIDGKDTGLATGSFEDIGPLPLDGSSEVYVQKEYPWGVIQSEKLPIKDSYIRVELEPENEAFRTTVRTAAKTFFQEMITALNTQDTSKAAHMSEPVKQSIDTMIQELKAQKAVYNGKVNKIAFDMDSIKLSDWGGEYKATVNMMVDLTESVHLSVDPSSKTTEDTSIKQTLELTYLEEGQWIVTDFYDAYSFNEANTEEILL